MLADTASVRTVLLGYGLGVPALTSALVVLATWRWRRTSWPAALAVGLGYAAGQVGVEGWRPFPPREATDRLWYLALVAAVVGLVECWRRCPAGPRWALRLALWLAFVWFVLPPALHREASRSEVLAWLIGLTGAGACFWAALARSSPRLPGLACSSIFLVVSAATAAVLFAGHSLKLAQLAGALAAALVPVVFRPAADVPPAPAVVLLPALWLTSYFFSYEPPPTVSLLLLAAAALGSVLGLLPGVRRLPAWQRGLICALASLLLTVAAVKTSQRPQKEEDDFYVSRPTRISQVPAARSHPHDAVRRPAVG